MASMVQSREGEGDDRNKWYHRVNTKIVQKTLKIDVYIRKKRTRKTKKNKQFQPFTRIPTVTVKKTNELNNEYTATL